jgi:hypothetical protein
MKRKTLRKEKTFAAYETSRGEGLGSRESFSAAKEAERSVSQDR